ncbi:1-phosphatidylinositol 4,5-bisphosphate phosphodiesterase delta-1a isoform X1 [Nothobranchius furzeri]|uniref:Phosphoinositide phospholipase C n=4 Tax=Nothobranchius TaxID=28779 RepID=A0A9D2Y5A7_NOTFU|nr:1-phosphatidylinositol 4,5-bisphosphate phosphodiesterase delta-1a isoform X1 [Nothobranchius furzeri]KAF7213827.1 transcript variant X1 [Nothobranchius furzeri]
MSCLRRHPKRTKSEERVYQEELRKHEQDNGRRLGLEGDPDLQFLLNGGKLMKVRSNSWQKNRFYKLQEDCRTMTYNSKKKFNRKRTFAIDDIESVRKGRQSEGLKKYTQDSDEDKCFSVIFKGRKKILDFMTASKEEANQWVTSLEKVISSIRNLNNKQKSEHWIINCMRKADKNKDNKMTLKELKHFLRQINVEVSDTYAAEIFKKCDTSNSGTLEGTEIKEFYDLLTHREEIKVIYESYAKTEGQMSDEDLVSFLQKEQREQASLADAHRLIEECEMDETAKQQKRMTKDGFLMYLQQEETCIFNPAHKKVYQDMTQPLNHYFISSSHNTYLMEDQLKGPSSTEAYIKALMKSCRCVELDCWDGPHGEPVIYHGHTLTSKVLFKDVIKAIKDYAFKMSEYPVILSLENHCAVDQQKIMARYLKSILGDALVTKPLGGKMPTNFPSPKELKGKFLIKGKRLNKLDVLFSNINTVEDEMVSEEDEAAECKENSQKQKPKKSKITLAKELSDVVIYCKSVHFSSFEHAQSNQAFYEMSSFKESKALMLAETSATAFIHHNMDKLSRIYPSGSRTDSSNYNPVPMWNVGCQIVALNFQTPSKEMHINQGRFRPNGFCGYILKPEFQRSLSSQFNPNTVSNRPEMKIFHVMVITAQQLPKINKEKEKSIVDPLVKVEIYGVPADNACKETQYINNNGFNPMWNERFEFTIQVPELAIVRFLVEDYDAASANDFIGMYCLPLTSVQNGYRHIPLLTKRGDIIPSAGLFVHLMLLDAQ